MYSKIPLDRTPKPKILSCNTHILCCKTTYHGTGNTYFMLHGTENTYCMLQNHLAWNWQRI